MTRLHVCFVCTGNICRSPLAEQVLRAHLDDAGLAGDVRVSSAGTGGWHVGQGADPRTVAVLHRHGYADTHTAARLDADHLDADLLVALDSGHAAALAGLGVPPERVRLLRSFDPHSRDGGDPGDLDVADPYYGGDADFELVLAQVEAAVPGLLAWVAERTRR
ncbi:low molecular weight protein-tyrosine-phosphatase [Rhodococcus aerolatus]